MTRPVSVTTPLGDDVLQFRSMSGREEVGRLFEYEVELLSKDPSIDLGGLVGQAMTVSLEHAGGQRHFHGVVSRLRLAGDAGNFALYKATLRPWLWRLTLRAGCRIFQNMTVPDIIKAIFREHGLTDFSESLSGTYASREYTVQYRESDFDFVSRWMEREGIYYFFRHESDRHTLVIADAYSAHEVVSGYEDVPYFPRQDMGRRERDHIDVWSVSQELTPSACVLEDFDFTRPKAELLSKLVSQHELADAAREIYDYPGAYTESSQGETYARIRVEEYNAQQELTRGEGDARGLAPGALFALSNHPRADQNREYLIVSAEYDMQVLDYESVGDAKGDNVFRCAFSSIPSKVPFRSRSLTPRPRVHGPQTAVVVGKSGEEIWTDEYGRVKLQFHWDREGKSDENASCWVRVAQIWGGTAWGGIHVPRIGQEVIVEFLEGDPDRPIVTGRVYNADNMPPYALPTNQTQSGIKSRSSASGTADNFNELRFEDKKDSEQVYLQAEKNFDTYVKNDETHTVDHDRKKDIKNDETTTVGGMRTETVEKDETITIKGKRTETVEKDESITINGARTEKVAKDETITIDGARTEKVAKDESITIDGARTEKVAKDETITIDGARTEKVAKDETITINGARTEKVAKDETITIDGARTEKVAKDETITISGARSTKVTKDDATKVDGARSHKVMKNDEYTVTGKFVVNATQGLELKVGSGSIAIDAAGNVTIKGLMVKVEGSGMVDVKASGILTLAGALIKAG
jgi:type VI secretion system secreted protein VgrG